MNYNTNIVFIIIKKKLYLVRIIKMGFRRKVAVTEPVENRYSFKDMNGWSMES